MYMYIYSLTPVALFLRAYPVPLILAKLDELRDCTRNYEW